MMTMGSVIVGVGVLLVALPALHHPRAPRWTTPDLAAMLMSVPVTGLIGGLGYVLFPPGRSRGRPCAADPADPAALKGNAARTSGPTLVSSLPEVGPSLGGPLRRLTRNAA